ncbi:MAG: 4-(cytidine 5'-diphospho)-2-C-methyl-D-erythritol kinase [Bacteroidetes bacterium]|nr:MAG: 4-(cytidine 5'-diphospho)-2-C-methyl-D-erythritol kinase [Bacteroidota bacterium]TAF94220.1 MAG: 4-(cytidine 5'-diphospho)-2-C-methyl-D-erythritol kinase [Bacteroidota bacterium]
MGTVVYPNAKINLGLYITEKRADGFHNLETVFLPIPWCDILEITPQKNTQEPTTCTITGLTVQGNVDDNLCLKAYRLLKQYHPQIPSFEFHLHKQIPSGAGLGGGSADASFVLTTLNKILQLNIPTTILKEYALTLGSDCPFFIENQPSLAFSRGEDLTPISLALHQYQLLIINPRIHVNTGWAFQQITPKPAPHQWWQVLQQHPSTWTSNIHNQFEPAVAATHPPIAALIEQLYHAGALYASMSGSGSTVYGLFAPSAKVATHFAEGFVHKLITLP